MRTTISLPDDLFESGEALAERLEVSRSRLYAVALAEFVAKHQHEETTARLDEVYLSEQSGLDPALRSAQARRVAGVDW